MDLRYSDSDEAFRAELRVWLDATLPQLPPEPPRDDWAARVEYDTGWQRRLFEAGYAGMSWPKQYGGRDASPSEQLIFLEECASAKAPYVGVNFVGMLHGGPTLIAEGTPEQKEKHIPRILRGEEVWCQCFSEPDAGSDLAGLKTRAVRDGDHYVVTGQKIWCSFGHVGEFGELLARTDPDAPKHRGISWFILPMDLPGVEVRPIETVLGSSEFCEVFLDEVRLPAEQLVGKENDGWRVTNVTLGFERGTAFVSEMVDAMRMAEELAPYVKDPADRRELGHVIADFDALWALTKRSVSRAATKGDTGLGGMIMKLAYSEARDRMCELSMRVLDRGAFDVHNPYVEERLRTLSLPIAAGTSQIQRNIISERVLGLPRERPWPTNGSG
jgi:alkylation response protein AidB-like acyl-CoA dehydrogenase